MKWNQLPVTIFINNRQLRQNLYFGEGVFDIPQNSRSYSTEVVLPFKNSNTKYMTFISGMAAKFRDPLNFLCDIEITQEPTAGAPLKIYVKIGNNLLLSKISLVYIAYELNGKDFIAQGDVMTFVNKLPGSYYASLDESLISTNNLIFGIKGLKQIISSSELVTFRVPSQFVLQVKLGQSL